MLFNLCGVLELELITQSQAGEDTSDLNKRLTDIKQQLILLAKKDTTEGHGPVATSTPIQGSSGLLGSPLAMGRTRRASQHKAPQGRRLDKRPRNLIVEGFQSDEKDGIIQHLRVL